MQLVHDPCCHWQSGCCVLFIVFKGKLHTAWGWVERLACDSYHLLLFKIGLYFIQTHLPPSTSILTPLINEPSSLARNKAVLATSMGSVKRPKGTLDTKLARFSGVSSTPTKLENKPVPERSGAIALTRMLSAPYSAARPFVACSEC